MPPPRISVCLMVVLVTGGGLWLRAHPLQAAPGAADRVPVACG